MKLIETTIDGKTVKSPYFLGTGSFAPREKFPTQERHSVVVIIKNPKTDEYLCVDAKTQDCKSFVMGGIETGETPEQAALREIQEETGYDDVEIDSVSDLTATNHFFAEYKNVNRYAYIKFVYGHLRTDRQSEVSQGEKTKQSALWILRAELLDFLNVEMCRWVVSEGVWDELCL
jgi:8-oxo-dGTP pyrophosphatase MutT (NUDIX family)